MKAGVAVLSAATVPKMPHSTAVLDGAWSHPAYAFMMLHVAVPMKSDRNSHVKS